MQTLLQIQIEDTQVHSPHCYLSLVQDIGGMKEKVKRHSQICQLYNWFTVYILQCNEFGVQKLFLN